jgi:hypothetical protein
MKKETFVSKLSVFLKNIPLKIRVSFIRLRIAFGEMIGWKNRKIVTFNLQAVFNVGDHVALLHDETRLAYDSKGNIYEGRIVDFHKNGYKVSIGNKGGQHQNYNAKNLALIKVEHVTERDYVLYLTSISR